MNRHHYGLILAGGRGTRFWPRSRKRSAKQVLNVVGDRIADPGDGGPPGAGDSAGAPLGADQRPPARHHHQAASGGSRRARSSPSRRSAIPRRPSALAAHILHSIDPRCGDGRLPVGPRGRQDPPATATVLKAALQGRGGGRHLMVVGIQPRWPETGYGYIEFPRGYRGRRPRAGGGPPVPREAANWRRPRRYVAAGNFYWNSGMFFWRADVLLDNCASTCRGPRRILASLPAFGSRTVRAPASKRCFSAMREHFDRLRGAGKGRRR